VLDKKTGQYVWAFPDGTTKPANVTGVDPNEAKDKKEEERRELSTIANGAYSLAQKMWEGGASSEAIINRLKVEYAEELRDRGYDQEQINKFVWLIRNASRPGSDVEKKGLEELILEELRRQKGDK